ncbi:hypothetical protein [Oryza sativa Japonica Group]|uniref:Uncharacterized protein P0581F09.8 n=1 Tax=Oryza sativa subsp. japonica TaxID=39947 RepID=Q5N7F2_ORYSJ|nr:hypothetical protein [Oryza sativa Japonica Group]
MATATYADSELVVTVPKDAAPDDDGDGDGAARSRGWRLRFSLLVGDPLPWADAGEGERHGRDAAGEGERRGWDSACEGERRGRDSAGEGERRGWDSAGVGEGSASEDEPHSRDMASGAPARWTCSRRYRSVPAARSPVHPSHAMPREKRERRGREREGKRKLTWTV